MLSARPAVQYKAVISGRSAAHILKALNGAPGAVKPICITIQQQRSRRDFSSTPNIHIKDFFPEPNVPGIRKTKAAWPHPMSVPLIPQSGDFSASLTKITDTTPSRCMQLL